MESVKTYQLHEQAKFWCAKDLDNLELVYANYANHSFARHTHEGFAIGTIERGAEAFAYRGATYFAPIGSIIVIAPEEVHTGYTACEAGCAYRVMYPSPILLQRVACELTEHQNSIPFFSVPVIQDEQLAKLIRNLHIALGGPTSKLERESRLMWTLAQLVVRHSDKLLVSRPASQETKAVRQVREHLEANSNREVALEELARLTNLNPSYLIRVFRNEVGLPPHAYQMQVRITCAKQLISLGYPLRHVAMETGFTDQSHLTKNFKRFVGITPGQYASGVKDL